MNETARKHYMERFEDMSSSDLVQSWPTMSPDEFDAAFDVITERAEKAGLTFGEYVRAEIGEKPLRLKRREAAG